jgi:TctA family transporter
MAYLKSFIKRAPLVVREYLPSFGNNITLFAVFSVAQKFSQNSKNFGASKIYDFRKLRIFGV